MNYDLRFGDFTFKHQETPAPEEIAYSKDHIHSMYELIYFESGDISLITPYLESVMTPHQLIIIKPGQYHHLKVLSPVPYRRFIIRFSENSLPPSYRERLEEMKIGYYVGGTILQDEIERFDFLYQNVPEEFREEMFVLQLRVLVTLLSRSDSTEMVFDKASELYPVLSFIDNNFIRIQSVTDIEEAISMSRSKIQKLFSKNLQMGVMEYVRTKKVILANTLLREGAPATIAYKECGFLDYTTFYRAFTKFFGHSPKEREQFHYKQFGDQKKPQKFHDPSFKDFED